MKAIWKYELRIDDETILEIPSEAQILDVQVQYGKPCIWVLVDPESTSNEVRQFHTYGIGHKHEDISGTYIGTYQLHYLSTNQ